MDRKTFHNVQLVGIIICVLGFCQKVDAQNLVPNPSFEEYTECPDNIFQIEHAVGWSYLIGPADYYHECGTNGQGVPDNRLGRAQARTGHAYVALATWYKAVPSLRKYLIVKLGEPLSEDTEYHAEFYVSMWDSIWYATRNIGMHFSDNPQSNNGNELLSLTPQVSYSDSVFLDDKIRWTRISGRFTAQGGEQYLAIGNFDNDANTDTAFVPGGGTYAVQNEGYWDESGYFIDDVSVVPDSIYLSNEDPSAALRAGLKVYPNPNAGEFSVVVGGSETDRVEMTVWSITGQKVKERKLQIGSNDLSLNVSDGLYLYNVTVNGESKWTGKVSVASGR